MLIAAIILVLIIAGICYKIYHTETHEILFAPGANFVQLGGWLILITLGQALTIIAVFFSLFTNNYFDLNSYNAHLINADNLGFKMLFSFEALGNITLMCYACFCLIMLINKRDILPKYIIGFYIFAVFFYIVDAAGAYAITGKISDTASNGIFRAIVSAAIWIPYFRISTRVQETFIVPYPHTNYSYEDMLPGNNDHPQ